MVMFQNKVTVLEEVVHHQATTSVNVGFEAPHHHSSLRIFILHRLTVETWSRSLEGNRRRQFQKI